MELKIGDTVKYFPLVGDKKYRVREVRALYPEGIPSCRRPMLMLTGENGVVLASHCEKLPPPNARNAKNDEGKTHHGFTPQ